MILWQSINKTSHSAMKMHSKPYHYLTFHNFQYTKMEENFVNLHGKCIKLCSGHTGFVIGCGVVDVSDLDLACNSVFENETK